MKRDDVALIEYEAAPITPQPWVYESNSEATWRLWDATVRTFDAVKPRNFGDLT